MNRNRKFFYWILTVLLVFIFQVTFSEWFSIFGVFPNMILLGTVYIALSRGPYPGELAGFVCGLFSDSASISLFGSQTFMLTLIGYGTGLLKGKINEDKPIAQMSVVLIMSLVYLGGLSALEALFGGSLQRFKGGSAYFQPVYSTLASPLVFYLLSMWDRLFRGEKPVSSPSL